MKPDSRLCRVASRVIDVCTLAFERFYFTIAGLLKLSRGLLYRKSRRFHVVVRLWENNFGFVSKYRALNIGHVGFIIDGFCNRNQTGLATLEIVYCHRKLFHGDELVVNIE